MNKNPLFLYNGKNYSTIQYKKEKEAKKLTFNLKEKNANGINKIFVNTKYNFLDKKLVYFFQNLVDV